MKNGLGVKDAHFLLTLAHLCEVEGDAFMSDGDVYVAGLRVLLVRVFLGRALLLVEGVIARESSTNATKLWSSRKEQRLTPTS